MTVTLKDIAGYDEEKHEAKKIIDVLKDYENYKKQGAYLFKGLLLAGAPGVGKTLLAKAIAGESGVPLYEFESNEQDDEAKTISDIRKLFQEAKDHAPSVILIDELDELVMGRKFVSDYSRKTNKVILTEIDGVNSSDGVLVIATTNHKADLPRALLRSGRMEKQISIALPELEDRKAIIEFYLKKHPNIQGIDTSRLAAKIAGFSGADIKSLINETIVNAIREKKEAVGNVDFEANIAKIRFGDLTRTPEKADANVCYHEIGHLLVNYYLNNELGSVSVQKTSSASGFTMFEEEHGVMSLIEGLRKSQIENSFQKALNGIAVKLAGMAAEKVFLDSPSLGVSDDLTQAKNVIDSLMNNACWGFELASIGSIPGLQDEMSERKIELREKKRAEVLNQEYEVACKVLEEHKAIADLLSEKLAESKTLSSEEVKEIIKNSCLIAQTSEKAICHAAS